MRKIMLLAIMLAVSVAAAGCLGNSVTISKSGGGSMNETRNLNCGASAAVSSSFSGAASFRVQVYDGDNNLIFDEGGTTGGWKGSGHSLSGLPGSWTLKVSGSYGGNVEVVLKC